MKKKIQQFINRIILLLQKLSNKLSSREELNIDAYNSLSPISDGDKDKHYSNALNWALSNRKQKDIRNIALTGTYGSGKSSILKTFQKNYSDKDYHFLNISLATFKEEPKAGKQKKEDEQGTDILRLLELSILQQIFYCEEDEKMPDSRFRKIKRLKKTNLFFSAIGLILFLISILYLINPNILLHLLKLNVVIPNWIHFSVLSFALIGFFFLIFKSIRIIRALKISQLNIQNTEIKMDSVSKSILNHHLDEIIYFFEVTKYNVVIIEDLDRFRETEIFTKLRELNLLLNNSKKTKDKNITFIYAVRDDMFIEDKERTKFFDFIIPVIPVINTSNSSQKLLEKRNLNKYDISDDLIDDIALFIDDMRLLHNITNEFYLYHQNLSKKLDQGKLLSIIVYKNLLPSDFNLLSNSEGKLYSAIISKDKYVQNEIEKIDQKIIETSKEIKDLEILKITEIRELRSIYVLKLLEKNSPADGFDINRITCSLSEILADDKFEYIIQNNFNMRHAGSRRAPVTQFNVIEKEISQKTYQERKDEIDFWNSNKIEDLKDAISKLEHEKNVIKTLKLKDLLSRGKIELSMPQAQTKHSKLINLFLRNGYIDEDYLDYISIFYEGSITKNDNQFLLSIKSQQNLEFNFKLNKIGNLISKINPLEFDKDYILNYDLVEYILDNSKATHLNFIFSKLKDESIISIKFIDGFIDSGKKYATFIKTLCSVWSNFWKFIEEKSNYKEDRKTVYYKAIFEHAELNDIKTIAEKSNLVNVISNDDSFLGIIEDKEKLKSIIQMLNLKFKSIDIHKSPAVLLDYVYENNHYDINQFTIKLFVGLKGNFNQVDYDNSNYKSISNSGAVNLIQYIDSNLDYYVKNVYLKIETNVNEDKSNLANLLNSEKISLNNKTSIIQKIETKIEDLEDIHDKEIDAILLMNSKVVARWENIILAYKANDFQVTDSIVTFLNEKENAIDLSKTKIPKDLLNEEEFKNFVASVLLSEEIEGSKYSLILKSVPEKINDLNFELLSEEKTKYLIESDILKTNLEIYNGLKAHHSLHIKLLEHDKALNFTEIDDFDIDTSDLLQIIRSGKFSVEQKSVLLERRDLSLILGKTDIIMEIGKLKISSPDFKIKDVILTEILASKKFKPDDKISLFNQTHNSLGKEAITQFLNSLDEPFSEITINGKRPLVESNKENKKLIKILEERKYISSFTEEKDGLRVSTFKKD